jgi:diguanylate cyclase (GGDEF)-like protein
MPLSAPSLPDGPEARRLALVRRLGLLDTPPEERFDVFTRLAASVTGAPVSTISLIDESRVWFASQIGLPEGLREIPRDIAACALVLDETTDMLVIPDATADPRVRESPLVTGAFGMRFYAGVPLRAPSGDVLGSLCIIDRVARAPDPQLLATLRDLANGVSSALRIHEMSELAFKDPLTGLGNRRMFEEALPAMLKGAGGARGVVGLLLVDLDRFKALNEMLGHGGGDAVLREVGQRILGCIREGDVAARLGGDEFVLMVTLPPSVDPEAELREIGARVIGALSAIPFQVGAQRLRVEASVGIAFAARGMAAEEPSAPGRADRLMQAADVALYNAKRNGRNRVVMQREGAPVGIGSKHTLTADLRAALAGESCGLSLVLQPQVNARGGKAIEAYEALVRWSHPSYGPIAPSDFVPIAERSGLAAALDVWVLREACRIAASFPEPRPCISVNITPCFLVAPDFLAHVEAALAEAALPPSALCIELTERVFLDDMQAAREATKALLARGIGVALDDFGAGHASFGYLTHVALTEIKLDGSLIAALEGPAEEAIRAGAILRNIIRMAHELKLGVVCEGVETAEQFHLLLAFGTDEMQGWHVGRPAPCENWLPVPRRVRELA